MNIQVIFMISNQEILAIHDISDGGLITSLIEMCFTKRIGMKVDINNFFKKKDTDKILNFMKSDKKNNSDRINLILIKNFGKIKIDFQINYLILKRFIFSSLK